MRVEYVCKHCNHKVDEIENVNWNREDVERYTGLSALTPQERMESVVYQSPNHMRIQTVCEDCLQAAQTNPQLLIEGKLLQ